MTDPCAVPVCGALDPDLPLPATPTRATPAPTSCAARRRDPRSRASASSSPPASRSPCRPATRLRAPAVGAGRPPRDHHRQRARHRRRGLPRRDPRQPRQPRPARAVHGAPRRPDRPARGPAGERVRLRRGGFARRAPSGGHWARSQRRLRARRPERRHERDADRGDDQTREHLPTGRKNRRPSRPTAGLNGRTTSTVAGRGRTDDRRTRRRDGDLERTARRRRRRPTRRDRAPSTAAARARSTLARSTTTSEPARPRRPAGSRGSRRHGAAPRGRRGGSSTVIGVHRRASASPPCSCRPSPRPRTEGIWDDIRTEIAASITDARAARPRCVTAPLGARAARPGCPGRTRTAAPSSRRPASSASTARAGSCAPSSPGRAAIDADAAEPLSRSSAAPSSSAATRPMAPRELLPLRLPDRRGRRRRGRAMTSRRRRGGRRPRRRSSAAQRSPRSADPTMAERPCQHSRTSAHGHSPAPCARLAERLTTLGARERGRRAAQDADRPRRHAHRRPAPTAQQVDVCGTVRSVTLRPRGRRARAGRRALRRQPARSTSSGWAAAQIAGIEPGRLAPGQRPGHLHRRRSRRSSTPPTRSCRRVATERRGSGGARRAARPTACGARHGRGAAPRTGCPTALGGWRGAVESAVPTVAFVVVWTATEDAAAPPSSPPARARRCSLRRAAGAAPDPAVRRVCRPSAIGIAAFFALRSGRAEDAFLPGILSSAGAAASLPARVGPDPLAAGRLRRRGRRPEASPRTRSRWRRHRGLVAGLPAARRWVLVALYVVRLAVMVPLYLAGQVAALGVAKIVLGWPAYLLAVAGDGR